MYIYQLLFTIENQDPIFIRIFSGYTPGVSVSVSVLPQRPRCLQGPIECSRRGAEGRPLPLNMRNHEKWDDENASGLPWFTIYIIYIYMDFFLPGFVRPGIPFYGFLWYMIIKTGGWGSNLLWIYQYHNKLMHTVTFGVVAATWDEAEHLSTRPTKWML